MRDDPFGEQRTVGEQRDDTFARGGLFFEQDQIGRTTRNTVRTSRNKRSRHGPGAELAAADASRRGINRVEARARFFRTASAPRGLAINAASCAGSCARVIESECL